MTERQASPEQTSGEEQSQADSQHGDLDQSQAPEQTSEPQSVKDLPGWAQKQIRDARKDAEKARTRVKEFEDAQKTEAERQAERLQAAEQRAADLEQKYRDAHAREMLRDAIANITTHEPSAAIELARPFLQFDDEGEPTNVGEAVTKVREKYPKLFPATGGSGDGGAGGQAPGQTLDMNRFIREQAGASR